MIFFYLGFGVWLLIEWFLCKALGRGTEVDKLGFIFWILQLGNWIKVVAGLK